MVSCTCNTPDIAQICKECIPSLYLLKSTGCKTGWQQAILNTLSVRISKTGEAESSDHATIA